MDNNAHKMGSAPWIWYFTNKLLNPMKVLLIKAFEDMPKEPTKENTTHPNAHALIDIRDWFLENLELSHLGQPYYKLYRALWNLLIIKYNCDSDYAFFLDVILEKWQTTLWKPRNRKPGVQSRYWKDDTSCGETK